MANGLASLLAAKQNKETSNESVTGQSTSVSPDTTGSEVVRDGVSGTASIQSDSNGKEESAPRSRNPFGGAGNSGRASDSTEPEAAAGSSASTDSGNAAANKPALAGLKFGISKSAPQSASPDASKVGGGTGLSLESLSESEDEGVAPVTESRYSDETLATKPTRELPDGLTKEAMSFIETVDSVYGALHEPDILGGVIRNILIELKSNPEYMKLVAPEDVRQWIRGMRESMGLAKIKKIESKAKRSGGGGRKSKLVDEDMMKDLEELGIGLKLD